MEIAAIRSGYKGIIYNFFYVALSFVIVNFLGYVFHAFLSRKIGPSLYAEFSAIYAFMLALSRPSGLIITVMARLILNAWKSKAKVMEAFLFGERLAFLTAVILGSIPLILYPFLSTWLKVKTFNFYLIVSFTLIVWSTLAVLRGAVTAVENFRTLALAGAAEAIVRAVFGIILVWLGFNIMGALVSSAIGGAFAILVLYKSYKNVKESFNTDGRSNKSTEYLRNTLSVILISIPVGFFLELDVALAKRFFDPTEAGIYAASALIGKGVLMFSTLFAGVIYPKLIKSGYSYEGLRNIWLGLIFTITIFGNAFWICLLFGKYIVVIFFGNQFFQAHELLYKYIVAILPLALHLQITNYATAIGGIKEAIWLWISLLIYYVAIEFNNDSFNNYLSTIFIVHFLLMPLTFVMIYLNNRVKFSYKNIK